MKSLRSLIPSFVLLAIYFIADEFFSPEVGLVCIVLLGGGELAYTYVREKRVERFTLLTTVLFCLMNVFAMYARGTFWEGLQPLLFELVLCVLFGVLAFSKFNFANMLPASYRKTMQITPEQAGAMRSMMRMLFYLLSAHLVVGVAATVFMPGAVAEFVTGTLLYGMIACFFVFLFVRNKLRMRAYRKEEWLPVVNEQGEVTGKAPRSVCHGGAKWLHPVVHLHIVSPEGGLFLQKRSMRKQLLPGVWDTAVGGHVGFGEKIEEALKREVLEEIGLRDFEARFVANYVWKSERERELVFSFVCRKYGDIHIDNEEVDEGRFWTREEILGADKRLLTPNFVHEYTHYIAPLIHGGE